MTSLPHERVFEPDRGKHLSCRSLPWEGLEVRATDEIMNDYDCKKPLGQGANGSTHLAVRKKDGQQFAIKLSLCMNTQHVNFALKEAKMLSTLKHDSIVRYEDVFLEDAKDAFGMVRMGVCIVMELCPNGDLHDYMLKELRAKKKTIDPKKALQWCLDLTLGLDYLHNQNIMHRDLKSMNIFLSGVGGFGPNSNSTPSLKIGDFGWARTSEGEAALTKAGTPCYASPEFHNGSPFIPASDVWGLGCIAFELLTLMMIYEMPPPLLPVAVGMTPVRAENIHKRYPQQLRELVAAMLRHDPVARPTASMCREVVEMIVNGEHPKAGENKSQQLPKDQGHSNHADSARGKGSQQTAKNGGAAAVQKPLSAQTVKVEQVRQGAQQVKANAQQSAQQANAQQSAQQAKDKAQQGAQQVKQGAQHVKDKALQSAQQAKEQLQQGAQQVKQGAQQVKQGMQQARAQQGGAGAKKDGGHASQGASEAGRGGGGAGGDVNDLMKNVKGKMKALFGYQNQGDTAEGTTSPFLNFNKPPSVPEETAESNKIKPHAGGVKPTAGGMGHKLTASLKGFQPVKEQKPMTGRGGGGGGRGGGGGGGVGVPSGVGRGAIGRGGGSMAGIGAGRGSPGGQGQALRQGAHGSMMQNMQYQNMPNMGYPNMQGAPNMAYQQAPQNMGFPNAGMMQGMPGGFPSHPMGGFPPQGGW